MTKTVLAAACIAVGLGGVAQGVTIDFEAGAVSFAPINSAYAGFGVEFSNAQWSTAVPLSGIGNAEQLAITALDIRRIELFQPLSGSGDGVAFDDLTFEPLASGVVPLPPAAWLLLSRIGALGALSLRAGRA